MSQSKDEPLLIGEAAKLLGVSVRTLERYTSVGRIPSELTPRGRRKVRLYQRSKVLVLKAELAAEKKRRYPDVRSPDAMRRIGFRLEPVDLRMLEEGAQRERLSPSEYARSILIAALNDTQHTRLEATLIGIERMLRSLEERLVRNERQVTKATTTASNAVQAMGDLRKDLASALFLLVYQLNQESDPDEVRAWIEAGMSGARE